MIRVLMIVRTTLYTARGGDTVQVIQTAAGLSVNSISVDIKKTGEQIDYKKYDLLHFFNITRPADMMLHIKRSGKPFVVSTIFLDYSEYDKDHRKGFAGFLFRFLSADSIEYIKTISRWLRGKDKLASTSYVWKGQRRSIIEILNKASMLLPNSNSEYERLVKRYGCKTAYTTIPNGVDPVLFAFNDKLEKDPKLVLCVARIEGIKNQYNLIKALNNTEFRLLIIGAAAPNQQAYYNACRAIAAGNVRFIEHLSQEELVAYYQQAKVHVLPSWFETTGLSSLEAVAMGCNIVITDRGDTREYFGNESIYCDPGSAENIYIAVAKAAALPPDKSLQEKILNHYTWQQATIQTMGAYKRIKNIWD